MRTFAAATVVAVAAALIAAGAFVVTVLSGLEASGALAGRATLAVAELPSGSSKTDQIRTLKRTAAGAGVDVSMLVPDHEARAGRWTAYTFRGVPLVSVFGGDLDVRPIGDGSDLDLRATFAINGTSAQIGLFLSLLDSAGFRYVDETPGTVEPLLTALRQPTTLGAALALLLGVCVALVAESDRRRTRQRLRRAVGWSRSRIAFREAAEIGQVAVTLDIVVVAAFALYLGLQGADATIWRVAMPTLIVVVMPVAAVIVALHVAFGLWWARDDVAIEGSRALRHLVGSIAVALVVLAVVDVRSAAESGAAAAQLERELVNEARHANDVVLGTTFTTLEQDVAFGCLAIDPLRAGRASLARMAFTDHITVAGDLGPVLDDYADVITGPVGNDRAEAGPVLLVPDAIRAATETLSADATTSLVDSWAVEGRAAPGDLTVRAVVVPSTSKIARSVANWAGTVPPDFATWPEVPVLVVPDPSLIAPNALGTAVANGEVRFADRAALERSVRSAGLSDTVLQVRRIGAIVEGKLAAVRAQQQIAAVVALLTGLILLFAAFTLTVDHRQRTQRSNRLFVLAGRHAVVRHRRFVLGSVALTFLVIATTDAALSGPSLRALALAGIAAVAVAATLTILLAFTRQHERSIR